MRLIGTFSLTESKTMQTIITPFLWFDTQAEEAMNFYASIFKDSEILNVSRNGDSVMSVTFQLGTQKFIACNFGPAYKFNEAISLMVDCKTQAEVDELWERLSEGGEPGRCGWLKDKFGMSWQIIPQALGELLSGPDPEKSKRVMEAMMQMSKIDVKLLEEASNREI